MLISKNRKKAGNLPVFSVISGKKANINKRKKVSGAGFNIKGAFLRARAKTKIKFARIYAVAGMRIKNSRLVCALKKPAAKAARLIGNVCKKLWFALLLTLFFVFRFAVFISKKAAKIYLKISEKIRRIWFKLKEDGGYFVSAARRNRKESILTFGVFAFMVFSMCVFNFSLEVVVNGQNLGRVSSQREFEKILHSVESRAATYLNHPYVLNKDIEYRFTFLGSGNDMNVDKTEQFLFSCIDDISVSSVLKVDGKIIAACDSTEELQKMLSDILSGYNKKNEDSTVTFVEQVEIDREPVSTEYIMDVSEIKRLLTKKKTTTGSYIVQKGDTLSGIALKCGIGMENLQAINQDINPNKIKIGQSLETSYSVSMLSVKETARITYTEKIAYETTVKKNDAMYTNEKKVVISGKYGTKKITADVSYLDGIETSRTIVKEEVASNPVTQIEYVGTKKPPAKSATGTFRRPYGGYISSNYGYRGREFHTGVDFAGPTGSAIVAADGGKVTFAGWNGNYGKCVIIRHSAGLETLYAHCSSLLVKAGDSVAKGQQIARVGSTGRSTGPHIHFEVRVNGQYVSPWKYIK